MRRPLSHLILPHFVLLITFFLLTPWVIGSAVGGETPWQITADTLIHYKQPECIFAEGNVIMQQQDAGPDAMLIKADWVRYDLELGLVKARGHVFIQSASEEVTADSAHVDMNSKTGDLGSALIFLKENHMYISGKEVKKTGESSYTIKEGWASACNPAGRKRLPWRIKASEGRITVEGLAVLKHASLQVKNVPVVYSPYVVFPANTKRETGFLFPEWSQSNRDGFGLLTPFFINLSPSHDITLYPGYMGKRGVMYGAEFRYVSDEMSRGTFLFTHLRDRKADTVGDDYKNDGFLRTDRNRYWFTGKADHDFGNNLVGRLDLDFVSDRDYLQEFQEGLTGYDNIDLQFLKVYGRGNKDLALTQRESSVRLTKTWSEMLFSGEFHTIQDVSDVPRVTTPLQALPRLKFNGRSPLQAVPLSVAWDSEYVNYWREEGVGAHRVDLNPSVITSLPRGQFLEGKMTVGLRETLYEVEIYGDKDKHTYPHNDFQDRTVFNLESNVATVLMRDFDVSLGDIQWIEHTVRPNVIYNYLPSVEQKQLPSLDGIDRVAAKNWITYELTNYFEAGGWREDDTPFSRNLGYFKVSQVYNVREDRRASTGDADKQRVLSDIGFELETYPAEQLKIKYETNLSVYGKGVTRYELITNYINQRGDNLYVDYRYLQNAGMSPPYFFLNSTGESQHDLIGSIKTRLTEKVAVYATLEKSFSSDHTVEETVGVTYKPHCWLMEVSTTRTIGEQRFMVVFSLDGIGKAFEWGKQL